MLLSLGITDAFEKDGFRIYPNPNAGSFHIHIPNETVAAIQLRSVSGKEVAVDYRKTVMGFELENRNLETGMYYLSLTYEDGTVVTKPVQVIN
ncbi:hypothetical protein D3C86_1589560 [compost metagenome]